MRRFSRLAMLVVAGMAISGCWPQPGFDAGRSSFNPHEDVLTRATVGRLGVLWTREVLPGPGVQHLGVTGLASVGNGVYATADNGRVARLDAATGVPVWSRVVDAGQTPTTAPPPALLPVYFDGRLRVSWSCCRSGWAGSFWLDPADGASTDPPAGAGGAGWSQPAIALARLAGWTDTPSPPSLRTLTWGDVSVTLTGGLGEAAGGSFAILGDRIHWSYGNRALRFGPDCRAGIDTSPDPGLTCEPEWQTDLGAYPVAVAAVGTGAVMWTDGSGRLTVLEAATGVVRWRATVGTAPLGPVVVAGDTIVVSTGDWLVGLPAAGCGAATCSPVWRAPVGGITGLAGGGDLVFATTSRGDVAAYGVHGCGEPTCGALAVVDVGDARIGSPIVDGGRLFVGDDAGRVVALGLPGSSG